MLNTITCGLWKIQEDCCDTSLPRANPKAFVTTDLVNPKVVVTTDHCIPINHMDCHVDDI